MRFADYPFLRYLPFILLGIFCGDSLWTPSSGYIAAILAIVSAAYLLARFKSKKPPLILLSTIGYLALVLFGLFLSKQQSESNVNSLPIEDINSYLAEVKGYDVKKANSSENLLEIRSIRTEGQWSEASAKVLIYHQSPTPLLPGHLILIHKAPEQIAAASNPFQFDYKLFLSRKGIHHRQFIGENFQLIDSTASTGLEYAIAGLRQEIAQMLKSKIPNEQSQQIALALLLGQKKQMDPIIRESYTRAGVMHILAVSGLHVGIIYLLLIYMLKPLKLGKRKTRIYMIAVIGIIWLYAFLTGLAPSVVRAATMFSLLTFGLMRERKPSIYNILAFSAILMISLNPDVIYEVGFQLSYLAVLGIVLVQPFLERIWLPSNKILYYLWELTTVSIAAQLVTFPLSVYYFHVFPTYFLLGNLVILPLAVIIMYIGVPMMIIGWFPFAGDLLGTLISKLIKIQIWLADLIQSIPGGALNRLSIHPFEMFIIWTLILIAVSWETASKRKLTWISLMALFAWSSFQLYSELSIPSQQLIVYHGKKAKMVDYAVDRNVYSWNQGMSPQEISFSVDPNRVQNHWLQIPESMFSITEKESQFLFPFPWKAIHNNDTFQFSNTEDKIVEIWKENSWQQLLVQDSLLLQTHAYRILF